MQLRSNPIRLKHHLSASTAGHHTQIFDHITDKYNYLTVYLSITEQMENTGCGIQVNYYFFS